MTFMSYALQVGARLSALGLFGVFWFKTQAYLAQYQLSDDGSIGDGVHDLLLPFTEYVHANPDVGEKLLIFSSGCIDFFATLMVLASVFGSTMRPAVAIMFVFIMRQVCQMVVTLPAPEKVFWRDPGVPSLFVTYETANDFFFSGHTAIAVVCAIEMSRIFGRIGTLIGVLFASLEIFVVLALQAHWTMDVFAGFVAARYATLVSEKLLSWLPALSSPKDDGTKGIQSKKANAKGKRNM